MDHQKKLRGLPPPGTAPYTQTPNRLLDEYPAHLSGAEFKVLMCIVRRTYGWGKTSDAIPRKYIAEICGIDSKTVTSAIKGLEAHGIISTRRSKDSERGDLTNVYEIKLDEAAFGDAVAQQASAELAAQPPASDHLTGDEDDFFDQ